jgi:hypothetical protein
LSPILVRPVREQLEHDRVIRQLQRELSRRKVEVGINPGAEQNVALGTARKEYPDVVLFSLEKGRKVLGVVEVETGESVNNLEAMAQWAHYARLRAPFLLYVPMGSVDVARRLAADNQIPVAEIHSYHQVGELMRFTLVHRSGSAVLDLGPDPGAPAAAPTRSKPAVVKKEPAAATKEPAKIASPSSRKADKVAPPASAKPAPAPVAKPTPAAVAKPTPIAKTAPMGKPTPIGKATPIAKPAPKGKPVAKPVAKKAPPAPARKIVAKKAAPKKAAGRRK